MLSWIGETGLREAGAAQPASGTEHLLTNTKILARYIPSVSSRTALVLLSLVTVAGTLLRFHLVTKRSLWVDEAASVLFARLPWTDFSRALWNYEGNMAFYYLLLRGWMRFGDSELVLRSLSVLFGVATIAATYLLAERLFGRTAGLMSAALSSVNAFQIRYSQEARSYSLLMLLVVLSTYFFLRSVDSPRQKKFWVAYILVSTLAMYSHVFAYLVVMAQWLSLGFKKIRRIGFRTASWALAGLFSLTLPMTLFVLFKDQGQLNWIPRPSIEPFLEFAGFFTGNGGNALLVLYVALCAVALFASKASGPQQLDESSSVGLVSWWLLFPIASTLLLSLVTPVFFDRYMVICAPALVILAGRGIVALDRFSPRFCLVSPLALLLLVGLSLWGVDRFGKSSLADGDDWRGPTRYVLARQQPEDALFFYRASGSRPFTYYLHREGAAQATASPKVIFPIDVNNPQDFNLEPSKAQAELAIRGQNRVWLVLHHYEDLPERLAAVAAIQAALREDFHLSDEKAFPGITGRITVSLYERASNRRHTSDRPPSRAIPSRLVASKSSIEKRFGSPGDFTDERFVAPALNHCAGL